MDGVEFFGEFFVLASDEGGRKRDEFDTLPDGDALFRDSGQVVGGKPEFELGLKGKGVARS